MSIWDNQQGRITRNGRLFHTPPEGSVARFLIAGRGEPVVIVVGPTHEPYYLFRSGERRTGSVSLGHDALYGRPTSAPKTAR